jgi:hypothetical protein
MTDKTAHPIGPAALARDWTARGWPCSRQYADRCIRKLGCPTDSFDAAFKWRTERTEQRNHGEGGGGPAGGRSAGPLPTARAEPPGEILGDSLDAVLARARQAEREQYKTYLAAVGCGDLGLQSATLKNHKEAQRNLIEVEQLVFGAKKDRGEFVSLPEAQKRIADRLSPLRAARSQLSRVLALALFPDAPHRAQPRIDAELIRIWDTAVATATVPLLDPGHAGAAGPTATPAAA